MGAVWSAKWARRRPSFAGQKSVAAKYAPFARRSGFGPPTPRNRCVAALASPLYTHIRHKARIPGHAFPGTLSRARIPGARFAPGLTKGASPDPSKHRRRRDPRGRRSRLSRPRRRHASARGFRGVSAAFGGFAARATASCIDLDHSVFAREHTFIACIANI